MNRYKITVILCSIGIALCLITMTLSTYAYFTVDIRGEGEDIDVQGLKLQAEYGVGSPLHRIL